MRPPPIDPWNTLGTTARLDGIERALKFCRKSRTVEEARAALVLIKRLAEGVEHHVDTFPAHLRFGQWPRQPMPSQPPPAINEER
jgi:hypothetical protein